MIQHQTPACFTPEANLAPAPPIRLGQLFNPRHDVDGSISMVPAMRPGQ